MQLFHYKVDLKSLAMIYDIHYLCQKHKHTSPNNLSFRISPVKDKKQQFGSREKNFRLVQPNSVRPASELVQMRVKYNSLGSSQCNLLIGTTKFSGTRAIGKCRSTVLSRYIILQVWCRAKGDTTCQSWCLIIDLNQITIPSGFSSWILLHYEGRTGTSL